MSSFASLWILIIDRYRSWVGMRRDRSRKIEAARKMGETGNG